MADAPNRFPHSWLRFLCVKVVPKLIIDLHILVGEGCPQTNLLVWYTTYKISNTFETCRLKYPTYQQ